MMIIGARQMTKMKKSGPYMSSSPPKSNPNTPTSPPGKVLGLRLRERPRKKSLAEEPTRKLTRERKRVELPTMVVKAVAGAMRAAPRPVAIRKRDDGY